MAMKDAISTITLLERARIKRRYYSQLNNADAQGLIKSHDNLINCLLEAGERQTVISITST